MGTRAGCVCVLLAVVSRREPRGGRGYYHLRSPTFKRPIVQSYLHIAYIKCYAYHD